MRYHYLFAGRSVTVCSDFPLAEDGNSARFRGGEGRRAELVIRLRKTPRLPREEGIAVFVSERFRLFRAGERLLLETLDPRDGRAVMAARFREEAGEVTLWLREDCPPELERMQTVWQGVGLPSQLLGQGALCLHSASVDAGDGVVLLCGRSGIGKSTQAALWEREGAEVLNGDRNALTLPPEGALAHGLPFCGTSGICRSYDRPLRAVVALAQAPENRAERLGGAEALRVLAENALGLLPGGAGLPGRELLLAAAERLPVYRLACTPDARAVRALRAALEEGN